jgi:hypothetical protein
MEKLIVWMTSDQAPIRHRTGNLLGGPRAESDPLLDRAFVETSDYYALIAKVDFNFVVGRRGTGKSALFRKTGEYYRKIDGYLLLTHTPPEHTTIEFQRVLARCETYRLMRAAARLSWRGLLLIQVAEAILPLWEKRFIGPHSFLENYKNTHPLLFNVGTYSRHVEILKHFSTGLEDSTEIPDALARGLAIEEFQKQVASALADLNLDVVMLFDRLDEGWEPNIISAAALGGVAMALVDFADAKTNLHGVVFLRDNMMRALAHFDNDYSRHIAGNTLQLKWNELSLLHFVASRLQVAFSLDPAIEKDVRIWNRCVQGDLQDREGFSKCLEKTLLRPRDVLILLNRAFVTAAREGRSTIVLADIQAASRDISAERLSDLLKEYDVVLPGLGLFVETFRNSPAVTRLGSLVASLDEAIAKSRSLSSPKARDFALLGTATEIISALHAVGFLGIKDKLENRFAFCYDGSLASSDDWSSNREVLVHPCYWEALNVRQETAPREVLGLVTDEYEVVPSEELRDIRTRGIGHVLGALANVPFGSDGAREFERWVLRVVQVLFQGALTNFEAKPNPGAVSQRDIVATNMATGGFWKRVYQDYQSRKVIFEAKNYSELTNDDLRQVLSYTTGEYGRFAMIVYRSEKEGMSQTVKAWLRELYHGHRRAIILMPTETLQRCLEKLRNIRKHDYTERQLIKKLDDLVRRYASIQSGRS